MRTTQSGTPLLFVLPLLVAAWGCSDSVSGPGDDPGAELTPGYALMDAGTDVALRAEAPAYQPGAPVTLVLENGTNGEVGFNLCFHALEHWDGSEWGMREDERICTTHIEFLSPGGEAEYAATLPEDLEAGEYRFRVAVLLEDPDGRRDQVSNSFEVEG